MLEPESNPSEGFTDHSDPDYPGMDVCLCCLFGDDEQSIGKLVLKSPSKSKPGTYKSCSPLAGASKIITSVTSHLSMGLNWDVISGDKSTRLVLESEESITIQVPVSQEGMNSPSFPTLVPLSPVSDNVLVTVKLPPKPLQAGNVQMAPSILFQKLTLCKIIH